MEREKQRNISLINQCMDYKKIELDVLLLGIGRNVLLLRLFLCRDLVFTDMFFSVNLSVHFLFIHLKIISVKRTRTFLLPGTFTELTSLSWFIR